MSSRWWFPFDGMEEMSFKRVPEGWVYRVPNPWLLGRSRYYLVSEKQKSEIAGHHRRMWLFLLLGIAVIAAVGAPLTLAGFDEQQVVLSLATAALLGLIVGFVANAWLCRTIRPIIADLTPTTQRITQSEVLNTQIAVFSRGYLLFFGSLSLLLFALIALQPLLTSAGWGRALAMRRDVVRRRHDLLVRLVHRQAQTIGGPSEIAGVAQSVSQA
jgi:hypothetical protein